MANNLLCYASGNSNGIGMDCSSFFGVARLQGKATSERDNKGEHVRRESAGTFHDADSEPPVMGFVSKPILKKAVSGKHIIPGNPGPLSVYQEW
ncbi:MAG: hypothetical protein KDI09_14710 [Halioglobus sp.]|nr:hypothetical protein [Halioglobus sp.]